MLNVLGILQSFVDKEDKLINNIETILAKHVFKEFENKSGFLRWRACYLLNKYGYIVFKSNENQKEAVKGIYKCTQDKELPISV